MRRFKDFLWGLWVRQENIYITFVGAMLFPNIMLCFTEDFSFLTIVASLLMPLGFYMLWGIMTRKPGHMMFAGFPLMVLGAFQLVIMYLFGGSIIAVDMFTNLFTTNASEAGELLGNIWPSVVGVIILYVPLLILAGRSLKLPEKLSPLFRKRMVIWVLMSLVVGFAFTGFARLADEKARIKYDIFPANVIYNMKLTGDIWGLRNRYYETSENFTFDAVQTQRPEQRQIYVLLVGEATRATNWSLFGYERETTPLLGKREHLVGFSRVTTESNTTHKSVPLMLSSVSAANYMDIYQQKSIITAFKEAGFHTIYVSNQVPNRSLIDFFSAEADERFDISPRTNELVTENRHDGEMIPLLDKIIADHDEDLFIVMHMHGSHFEYNKRYPESFACYQPHEPNAINRRNKTEVVNSYDNSILYNDYVVDNLIEVVKNSGACSMVFYCSDHGDDLLDDNRGRFLHASPTPTYYQLHTAMVMWFSEPYLEYFPEAYRNAVNNREKIATTANVFHTMTSIAHLKGRVFDPTYSLINDEFQERKRIYLNDHQQMVTLEECGLKPQDIEMMNKHHIFIH